MVSREFEIFSPQRFFEDFVERPFKEHLNAPTDRYHIKIAIQQANILAERVWAAFHDYAPEKIFGCKTAAEYRNYLVKNICTDFQLVWDLDDGHKHVSLRRENRKITSAAQSGIVHRGGAFDAGAFDNKAFQVGKPELVVRLDSGIERSISEILTNVVEMWRGLLSKL